MLAMDGFYGKLHKPAGQATALWITLWIAGWSSPVARQAHNLKAAGSNPAPATIFSREIDVSGVSDTLPTQKIAVFGDAVMSKWPKK